MTLVPAFCQFFHPNQKRLGEIFHLSDIENDTEGNQSQTIYVKYLSLEKSYLLCDNDNTDAVI